jgi:glucose-6-phosphate dehydrogenase assembly protein OpcA
MTTAIEPERILKELRNLWTDLGKEQEHGVLRACAMTFIVATDGGGDEQELGEMIASLMHQHPSRAIVLRIHPGEFNARVFAQCWMPFGKRQQICCEQVEITSPDTALKDAASLITGIAVPDLPVVLYLRSPEWIGSRALEPVLPLATKLIADSSQARDKLAALDLFRVLLGKGSDCADLAWTRLTPWRESVSQIFDHSEARNAVSSIDEVRIVHSGAEPPVSALYMGGWFQRVLQSRPKVTFETGTGQCYDGLLHTHLRAPGGFEASVQLVDCCQIESKMGDVSQRLVFPPETEGDALHQELGILGQDAVYRDVLELASRLRGKAK